MDKQLVQIYVRAMFRSWIGVMLAVLSLCGLFAARAIAHPAAGNVVNAKGEVFFIHTGQGVCKIDTDGKLRIRAGCLASANWDRSAKSPSWRI